MFVHLLVSPFYFADSKTKPLKVTYLISARAIRDDKPVIIPIQLNKEDHSFVGLNEHDALNLLQTTHIVSHKVPFEDYGRIATELLKDNKYELDYSLLADSPEYVEWFKEFLKKCSGEFFINLVNVSET